MYTCLVSILDSDSGIPPMPLRKIKGIGEDLKEIDDEVPKFPQQEKEGEKEKEKKPELVGFKSTADKHEDPQDKVKEFSCVILALKCGIGRNHVMNILTKGQA